MDALTAWKISVVIPVKDRIELAKVVLNSILNQTRLIDELVLVDDGSIIPAEHSFSEELIHFSHKQVKTVIIRNSTSKGVSCARNQGFESATGDLVLFCDSDDYWLPQKVQYVTEHFAQHPESVIFVHSFRWLDGTQFIFRILPEGAYLVFPRWLAIAFAFANPSCLSIKKCGFNYRFNESMKYHEDLEFILRAMETIEVHFMNTCLMIMGRAPGDIGGATQNLRLMRNGAILALSEVKTAGLGRLLIFVKCLYHRFRLFGLPK